MKFVKLTAKPNTWFKEGTEVYNYDCNPPEQLLRVTLEEWESSVNFNGIKGICVCGFHIPQRENEIDILGEGGCWDGEFCSIDEFEVEIVNEPC